jgi:glycine betaine transporter
VTADAASKRPRESKVNLFRVSLPICAAVAIAGIVKPDALSGGAKLVTGTAFRAFDWFFMATTSALLVVAVVLAGSRYGRLRLGKDDERPEFSTTSWLAMLFAAGMGVGLLFWGVAEPITHFVGAPGAAPGSPPAARRAMVITMFHWGFHAWAVYAMAALVLAYFGFRRGEPYLPGAPLRASFKGRWVYPASVAADLVAVLAVVFGVAASVPMGILQLMQGLHVVAHTPADSDALALALLAILFVAYMTSAATSLDKGIKWLSNINMALAIALALFVLIAGPTTFILRSTLTTLGDYLSGLASVTSNCATSPARPGTDRVAGWSPTSSGGSPGRPSWACSSRASAGDAPCASSSSG